MATEYMAYDGSDMYKPLTKEELLQQREAIDNGQMQMTDDEYLYDVLSRTLPSRKEVAGGSRFLARQTPVSEYVGYVPDLGTSRLDKKLTVPEQLENLENSRAYLQSSLGKIGAGIAKGVTTAATVYLDGMVGLVAGIGNIIDKAVTGELDKDHMWSSIADAFIDNPVSHELAEISKVSENIFRNFYTDIERNRSGWENIFTANFIGDTLLKNLGFVVGAGYSGKSWASMIGKATGMKNARNQILGLTEKLKEANKGNAKIMEILKGAPVETLKALEQGVVTPANADIAKQFAESAKKLMRGSNIMKATGIVMASMGEARIEAINGAQEYLDGLGDIEAMRNEAYRDAKATLYQKNPSMFQYVTTPTGGTRLECVDPKGQALLQQEYDRIDKAYEGYMADVERRKAWVGNHIFALNLPILMASNLTQFGKMMAGDYDTGRIIAKGITESSKKNAVKTAAKTGIDNLAEKQFQVAEKSLAEKIMGGVGAVVKNPVSEGMEEMGQAWASSLAKYKGTAEVGEFAERLYDPDGQVRSVSWLDAAYQGLKESFLDKEAWIEGFTGALMGALGLPGLRTKSNGRKGLTINGGIAESVREYREQNRKDRQMVDMLNERLSSPEFRRYYYGLVGRESSEAAIEDALQAGDFDKYDKFSHMSLINDLVMFREAGMEQEFLDMFEGFDEENLSDEKLGEIRQLIGDLGDISDKKLREQILNNIKLTKDRINEYVDIANNLEVVYGNSIGTPALQEMAWVTARMSDIKRQVEKLEPLYGAQIRAYRSLHEEEGNKLPESDVDLFISDGFQKYLKGEIEKMKEDGDSTVDQYERYARRLTKLYNDRIAYYNILSQMSDDPGIVEHRMQYINGIRQQDMDEVKLRNLSKTLRSISTYGELDQRFRNDQGRLTTATKMALRGLDKIGRNKKARFLLEAEEFDYQMRQAIESTVPEDVREEALKVWQEHISAVSDINHLRMEVPNNLSNRTDVIAMLNGLVNKTKQQFADFESRVNAGTNIKEGEYKGRTFTRINNANAQQLYYMDDSGEIKEAKLGEHYVDVTSGSNPILYSDNGTRLGIALHNKKGAIANFTFITNNKVKYNAEFIPTLTDNTPPWDIAFGRPKSAQTHSTQTAEEQRKGAPNEEPQKGQFKRFNPGDTVMCSVLNPRTNAIDRLQGTVDKVSDTHIRVKVGDQYLVFTNASHIELIASSPVEEKPQAPKAEGLKRSKEKIPENPAPNNTEPDDSSVDAKKEAKKQQKKKAEKKEPAAPAQEEPKPSAKKLYKTTEQAMADFVSSVAPALAPKKKSVKDSSKKPTPKKVEERENECYKP